MAAPFAYTNVILSAFTKLIDATADTFMLMLLDDTSTPDTVQDTAQFVVDVLAVSTEIAATGPYSAGGIALTTTDFAATGGVFAFTCDPIAWGAGALSAAFGLVLDATPGSDATNPVIGWIDFGGVATMDPFTVTPDDSGLIVISRA